MITRDNIKEKVDLIIERVDIPEWNDFIFVRSITAEERDLFENSMYTGQGDDRQENLKNLRARLVVLAACDEAGKRIFKDSDTEWLGRKNALAVNRIFQKAQELGGFKKEDIDTLTKNSKSGQSADSILE